MPVSKISVVGDRSLEARRVAVDRPALGALGRRRLVVDRVAEHVPDAAERRLADRDGDRLAGVDDVDAAREAVGRVHRDGADAVVAEVLLHLRDRGRAPRRPRARDLDLQRGVDLRQALR